MQKADNTLALRNLSALVDFSDLINSSLKLNFIFNNLLLTCLGKLHTSRGIVTTVNSGGDLEVGISKGLTKQSIEKFPKAAFNNYEKNEKLRSYLKKNKLILSEKIISANKNIGVIFLGEIITSEPYKKEDKDFLKTILNIAATALENSLVVDELKDVNKNLDTKLNQLSTLFDLSKEFSGTLEISMINKLLVFSIIGQLLVSKYAVVKIDKDQPYLLDSKFPEDDLNTALQEMDLKSITNYIDCNQLKKKCEKLSKLGVQLIIPMQINQETKGLILLGERRIGGDYSKSDIEFVSSIGSLAIISIENSILFKETLEKQRLEKDLEIARKIQKNLLPSKLPEMNNFNIAAYNNSAKQVGGDYYDAIKLDENRTLVAIGDVSGKGVQAALLMANLQAFLQSISKQNIELSEASNLINDLVSENTTDGSFITFFWGILNDETKEIQYVNMGHNPPLLVRDGNITKLKLGGMILGVVPTMVPYKSETVELQKDDLLILFTDGITEAMNYEMKEFSDERLERLAVTLNGLNANEVLQKINTEVEGFTKGAPQSDDVTCVIIRVN